MSSVQKATFSSVTRGFQKRAAPMSFVSSFSRQQPQSRPVDDSLLLPLECAFSLPYIDAISNDKYLIAVGNLLGGQFHQIIYGGKNGSNMVMHLCSQAVLNEFVSKNETVKIDEHVLPVKRLIDTGLVLYLHNVAPHLPNEVLVEELRKHVRLMSDLKLSSYGMKDPRLRHVLTYKRQVQIPTEDKEKVPIFITVTWKKIPYMIYLSFDSPRCYTCGKEGHMSKNCEEPGPPSVTPAQKRLDEFREAASVAPPIVPQNDVQNKSADEMECSDDDDGVFVTGTPLPSTSARTAPAPVTPKNVSSPPSAPENDFFPNFQVSRSSSLPSLTEDDSKTTSLQINPPTEKEEYPALKEPTPPPQEKRKRLANSESNPEKTKKKAPSKDQEINEGFKTMVQKIVDTNEQLSVTADQICELIAKLKNSQKKQEIFLESNLPISDVRFILQEIHADPDTTVNMKSRITRLLNSVLSESKMTLVNVESV
ncbi:hypothetical protein M8J77_015721 [Diaphorina citri]|nr:hypothetical protein M8J77_015721 [Diaphorina citri]